jgi:putative transposase
VKKSSNEFIKKNKLSPFNFQWQEGYGAFSYSHRAITNVISYINKQKEHHCNSTFKDEYLKFLELYIVDYNQEYLFDGFE